MIQMPLTTICGTVLVALAVYGAGITYLYKESVDAHSKLAAALALAEKQAEDTRQDHERNLRALAVGWDTAVRALDRAPAVRVRKADYLCQDGVPTAASGLARSTSEHGLVTSVFDPREISLAECEARLNNSLKASAQVLHLLDFAYRTHEASK